MGITRDNHYVPRWYLNRFIENGERGLYCLDLEKVGRRRPDGIPIPMRSPRPQPVKSLFFERDLYTTFFGVHLSDEIERRLFGPIDDSGCDAVMAFANGRHKDIHDQFQTFYRYLNAQLLRTPKGLSWLAAQFSNLAGNDRLMEMQRFLHAYCPMWIESVMEIVSAANSKVKFLVTDAPVTLYNAACPPESEVCRFPFDPRVELIGTQTLFPLGAEQLMILTHLQYAKPGSGTPNLTGVRVNARYHGMAFGRTDAIVRDRSLTETEVSAVNMVLKARAKRYVAAGNPTWLHPERSFTGAWNDVAPILLPRKENLWRFGGEVYVGFKDGTTAYRDEHGRRSKAHELLKKKPAPADLAGDAECGCGSGQRFDTCCQPLPAADRPAWDVLSIRERNLILCRAIAGILELDKGKDWAAVRRDLSDEQVQRIYQLYAGLWPDDTDLAALLLRPSAAIHRGVLLGLLDARSLGWTVAAQLGCFDELVLPHPFMHHEFMSPNYSPVMQPRQHKMMLLRCALVMLQLQPLIEAGLVHLVPDLMDFNPQYMAAATELAKERAEGWNPSSEEWDELNWMHRDDMWRAHLQLPLEGLQRLARDAMPDIDDDELAAVTELLQEWREQDPLALLQPGLPGERASHLLAVKGFNIATASFFSGLVGGTLYCDNRLNWGLLRHSAGAPTSTGSGDVNSRLQGVSVPVLLDIDDAQTAREVGADTALRQCFRALRNDADAVDRFDGEVLGAVGRAWHAMGGVGSANMGAATLEVLASREGIIPLEAQRLQLQFARRGAVAPTRLAVLIRWDRRAPAHSAEKETAAQLPEG